MVDGSFEHIRQARNAGMYIALGLAMSLTYLIWAHGSSVAATGVVSAFLFIVLHRLAVNPTTGFRLTWEGIDCIERHQRKSFTFAEIDAASVITLHDGSTRCWLNLRNGGIQTLPGVTSVNAEKLVQAFRDRGIWVSRSPVV